MEISIVFDKDGNWIDYNDMEEGKVYYGKYNNDYYELIIAKNQFDRITHNSDFTWKYMTLTDKYDNYKTFYIGVSNYASKPKFKTCGLCLNYKCNIKDGIERIVNSMIGKNVTEVNDFYNMAYDLLDKDRKIDRDKCWEER